jgi:hypothetical protein
MKAILADPLLREELIEGATDFICKVEGIRPSFVSEGGEAAFKASREKGLSAALLCIAKGWAAEIKGQPKTEFIRGISNSIAALREIAFDIEQATNPTSDHHLETSND